MKTMYIDCSMGAAGDMLCAALLELIPNKNEFIDKINNLGIPSVNVSVKKESKCGIMGNQVLVKINGVEENEHTHSHEHIDKYITEHEHKHIDVHTHKHPHERINEDAHIHSSKHKDEDIQGHSHEHKNEHTHIHSNEHENEYGKDHSYEYTNEQYINSKEGINTHTYSNEDIDGYTHNHPHEHHYNINKEHHSHNHQHNSMRHIEKIISSFDIEKKVKDDILSVYSLIAKAESMAHGKSIEQIHFHEVGEMDAIADITMVCMLINEIAPDKIIVSPVNVGSGSVKCAHGILPVPAPATAYLLKDVPIYNDSEIQSELCTPTGAAILKHFATDFSNMPIMKTLAIGYGFGKKDFKKANLVRIMLGKTDENKDKIIELSCNVDDMTAEEISFAMDMIFEIGAKDVYTIPIGMKKSRMGILLCVICKEEDKENIIKTMFKHTSTLGIRENVMNRYILSRDIKTIRTPYTDVRCKKSYGYDVTRTKYEYDDLKKIAKKKNISLEEAKNLIKKFDD